MEDVEEVKKRSKRKESRYEKRYGFRSCPIIIDSVRGPTNPLSSTFSSGPHPWAVPERHSSVSSSMPHLTSTPTKYGDWSTAKVDNFP